MSDIERKLEAERDELRLVLAAIRETAAEQTCKPGAPVEHALDFIVALDRILRLVDDAAKEVPA